MSEEFGPWIVWGKKERPAGLRDDQLIQVVFINSHGELGQETRDRSVKAHSWDGYGKKAITLAYRVKREEKTHVLYGVPGKFNPTKGIFDTHKITYVMDGEGEVMSCKMEKL